MRVLSDPMFMVGLLLIGVAIVGAVLKVLFY
jgi:hypothetical protein